MIDRGEFFRKLALHMVHLTGIGAGRFAGAGAILMLHRVNNQPDTPCGFNKHLAITPEFLDAVLGELKSSGFHFVSMDEIEERLLGRAGSERFLAITADDGYRDNLTCALPVLEKHQAPMTIYIAPGLTDGRVDLWWEVLEEIVCRSERVFLDTAKGRVTVEAETPAKKFRANAKLHAYLTAELPEEEQRRVLRVLGSQVGIDAGRIGRDALMDWDEVRRAAAHPLLTIGAHTLNHYNLKRLAEDKVRDEMLDSARYLEIELGSRPNHLAYPYGYAAAVGERETRIAAELGFATAVTTRHGVLHPEHLAHMHALPRISVNGRYQRVSHVRTMVSGVTTPLANRGKAVVTL